MPSNGTTQSVRTELLEATGITEKKKETHQALARRLVEGVQELGDDGWEDLSEEAQRWVNAGAEAIEADGDNAEFEEFPDEADEDEAEGDDSNDGEVEHPAVDQDSDEEEEVEAASETAPVKAKAKPKKKAPAKAAAPAKADPKPKAKAAKAAPAKAEPKKASGPKSTGVKVRIKKMVIKKPAISVDEIMERLSKDGGTPSKLTVAGIRAEFRHSLFVLRDEGLLPDGIKLD